MGSIVESKKVGKDGKAVTIYRAHIRRTGFKSQSKSFRTKTEAKEWLRNNEATVLLEKKSKGAGTTFSKLAELFAAAPPMKGTRYWDAGHLDFWIEQFGPLRLNEVTHGEINAAVAVLQTRPAMRATSSGPKPTGKLLSPATVNRHLATLSAVMNFALKRGMIEAHPMKAGKVEKLTEGNGRKRVLTDEEVTRLLAAAEGTGRALIWSWPATTWCAPLAARRSFSRWANNVRRTLPQGAGHLVVPIGAAPLSSARSPRYIQRGGRCDC